MDPAERLALFVKVRPVSKGDREPPTPVEGTRKRMQSWSRWMSRAKTRHEPVRTRDVRSQGLAETRSYGGPNMPCGRAKRNELSFIGRRYFQPGPPDTHASTQLHQ